MIPYIPLKYLFSFTRTLNNVQLCKIKQVNCAGKTKIKPINDVVYLFIYTLKMFMVHFIERIDGTAAVHSLDIISSTILIEVKNLKKSFNLLHTRHVFSCALARHVKRHKNPR